MRSRRELRPGHTGVLPCQRIPDPPATPRLALIFEGNVRFPWLAVAFGGSLIVRINKDIGIEETTIAHESGHD